MVAMVTRLPPAQRPRWSRRVCGVALLEATGDAIGTKVENIEIKANYDTFMNWLRRAALDEVYIDVPMDSGESFIPYLEEMESMGLTVHFRMPLLDRIEESCCNETSSARLIHIHAAQLMDVENTAIAAHALLLKEERAGAFQFQGDGCNGNDMQAR